MRVIPPLGQPYSLLEWLDSSLILMDDLFDGNLTTCVTQGNYQVFASTNHSESANITIFTDDGVRCDRDITIATWLSGNLYKECDLLESDIDRCIYNCDNPVTVMTLYMAISRMYQEPLSLCEITEVSY